LALIEAMSEAELFRTYTPAGRDASSTGQLIDWVAGDTYDHYIEHHKMISALIGEQAATA
jgi:hypothetical protein